MTGSPSVAELKDGDSIGGFTYREIPTAEVEAIEQRFVPLTEAIRRLNDVVIRSTADPDTVAAAVAQVDALTAELGASAVPGPIGTSFNHEGHSWNWSNAAIGPRNAVAPPLRLRFVDDTRLVGEADLGNAYEGPPGKVHGGVSALLLDHFMGEAASRGHTQTAFTGTLTMRYEAPLPLGKVTLEGELTRQEGRKIEVEATIADADGGVAIRAHGVFITPKWATDLWEQR